MFVSQEGACCFRGARGMYRVVHAGFRWETLIISVNSELPEKAT